MEKVVQTLEVCAVERYRKTENELDFEDPNRSLCDH